MDVLTVGRAVLGVVLVAVLPGYVWSRVFFPKADAIERALASVVLSMAMMALVMYAGNLLIGIRISVSHAIWWSLGLSAAGWATAGAVGPAAGPPADHAE